MEVITDKELIKNFKHYGSYYATAKELGLSPSTVKHRLNALGFSSSYSQEHGRKWVKLNKTSGPSRVVPITGALIDELGFKPSSNLYGHWEIKNGQLTLRVMKIGKGKGLIIKGDTE